MTDLPVAAALVPRADKVRAPRRAPIGLILPAAILVAWEIIARSGQVNTLLLPPPSAVIERLFWGLASGSFLDDIGASLLRLSAGVLIGGLVGIPLGLSLGTSRIAALFLGPTFNVVKHIALFAWIPLISVWLGSGEAAKVAFVTMAVFTPTVINAWEGAAHIPADLKEVASVYRFSPVEKTLRLIVPSSLPQIFTGLRLGLIYGWLATIGAEYFMTVAPGIGSQMTAGRELLEMDLVLAGVLMLGAIGFGLNLAAERLERHFVRWKTRI